MNTEKLNIVYEVKSNGFVSQVTIYKNNKVEIHPYDYQADGASNPVFNTSISRKRINDLVKHLEDILKIKM